MANFITNEKDKNLKKRLIELIKNSEELKFLVGFFYFSGIRELYEGLKSNPNTVTKVLVGLSVDRSNYGLIEFSENEQLSDEEKVFIKKDKLIIRKTYKPNHAKLYLFKLDESQVGKKNLLITGSSNLTKAGLSTQDEFNVEIGDYGFDDAEKYFDELWDEAVKITEYEDIKKKLIEVIEQGTLIKKISPFEAFCLALKTYLDSFAQKGVSEPLIEIFKKNGYTPYKYQLDSVGQALAIIESDNGVIIADVVGLGKTIIACAIAHQLNKRGIIICPPGIVGDKNKNSGWKKYTEEFNLREWEVRSRGDLESALDFVDKFKDIEVVIIDEAHWFRNQDTKNYELLKNICRDKIVILLTATPFNNRPGDILSLLKLFITPKKSSLTLENNLVDEFNRFKNVFDKLGFIKKYWNSVHNDKKNKALNYYKGLFEKDKIDLKKVAKRVRYLAKQIRNIIEPVTIRRNRLDLQSNLSYKDEVKNLSKIADPKEWFFELTEKQSEFYDQVINKYFGEPDNNGRFKGAIYRPFEYEKGFKDELGEQENRQFIQQRNLFDFMRRLIVKRFESSFGSFKQSIENFKKITKDVQKFIEKTGEYILDRDLLEKIYSSDIDDIEKYLVEYEEKINKGEYPKNHKRYKLKDFKLKNEFLSDIQSDLDLFDEILSHLANLDLVKNDPKTHCLIKNIKQKLAEKPDKGEPKRKVIIFSEYVDTVNYLKKELEKNFKERILVVSGGLSSSKIAQINENFDASYPEQKNDFDILLSSDKISEGFNLNRAGMVINYDIPWNPVRVIQRVGRINRISKKVFNELYIVNFFPTEKGAELVKSREIAQSKMFLIHSALGEDAKIFDIDEEPTPAGLYAKIQQNPDEQEGQGFYTKAFNEYERIKKEHPEMIESFKSYPPRVKVAKKSSENELLVFYKKGRLYVSAISYGEENNTKPYQISFEDVFEKIVCKSDEKFLNWNTERFWQAYSKIQNFKNQRSGAVNEQSLEQKALKNLDYFIRTIQREEIMPFKDFLRTLREDILDYGTPADYTLRRIANLKTSDDEKIKKAIEEIKDIKKGLGGEDYYSH